MAFIQALIAAIAVSLVAVLAILPFLFHKKVSQKVLIFLLSLSVGTLLGVVFLHFLPEAMHDGFDLRLGLYVIGGFLVFFLIERFIHHHHHHAHGNEVEERVHAHGYTVGPLNIIGDAVHNFLDGLVIAGAFLVNIPVGIAATISIALHEIPQEIADFAILMYSGYSKKRALFFNALAAVSAIVGVVVGFLLAGPRFESFILPFASGAFLYIAAANLTPELHRHCSLKDSLLHILAIVLGVAIMVVLMAFTPAH